MESPNTRVVEFNLDDKVTSGLDELRVTSLWVVGICDRYAIPGSQALRKHLHVVTVDVHGVRGWEANTLHDDTNGVVGAEIVNGSLIWEVQVAEFGFETSILVSITSDDANSYQEELTELDHPGSQHLSGCSCTT